MSGNVYRMAVGQATPAPIDFGNLRVGDATSQALTVANTAVADDYSESLGVSASQTGSARLSGGVTGLIAAGASDTGLSVGLDTSVAGVRTGTVDLAYVSDGTGTSGLAAIDAGGQSVAVSGNVYRLAEASVSPVTLSMSARVGDSVQQAITVANIAAADGFSEDLSAMLQGTSGDALVSGGIAGLIAAGASDGNLMVGLDTSSAGAKSGMVTIGMESDGSATSGFTNNVALGNQTVAVSGNVYTMAAADVATTTLDFGIVHVGDVIGTQALQVSNTAAVTALNDVLQGSFAGATGPFTASGNLGSGVAAGDSDNSSLVASMDTGTAGIFASTGTVSLASQNGEMADYILDAVNVTLLGQVNEFANPAFDFVSGNGSLSGSDTSYLLDFGTIVEGTSSVFTADLGILNDVVAPADLLAGLFDLSLVGSDFAVSGFDAFGFDGSGSGYDTATALRAGDLLSGLMLSFDSAGYGVGLYTGSILLNPYGFNASGYDGMLSPVTLAFNARVIAAQAVPEPGSFVLFMLGSLVLVVVGVRRRNYL